MNSPTFLRGYLIKVKNSIFHGDIVTLRNVGDKQLLHNNKQTHFASVVNFSCFGSAFMHFAFLDQGTCLRIR